MPLPQDGPEINVERIRFYIPMNVQTYKEDGKHVMKHDLSGIMVTGDDFPHALSRFRIEYASLVEKLLRSRFNVLTSGE